MRKRIAWMLVVIMVLIGVFTPLGSALAADADPPANSGIENMVKSPHEDDKKGDYVPFYEKYPVTNYQVDSLHNNASFFDFYSKVSTINSYFFIFQVFCIKMVIYLLEYAWNTIDLFEQVEGVLDEIVIAIKDALWQELLGLMILLIGGWCLKKGFIDGELATMWRGLTQSFLVLLAGLTFFFMGSTLLGWTLDQADQIGKGLLDEITSVKSFQQHDLVKAEDPIERAGEQFMVNFAYIPWQLQLFGDYAEKNEDGKYTGRDKEIKEDAKTMIALDPMNPKEMAERVDHVQKWTAAETSIQVGGNTFGGGMWGQILQYGSKAIKGAIDKYLSDDEGTKAESNGGPTIKYPSMTMAGLGSRIIINAVNFAVGTLYGLMLLLHAASIIFYQLLAIILTIISPFVFLLALHPAKGPEVLRPWAERLIAAAYYKVVISVLLGLVLLLSSLGYKVGHEFGGWLGAVGMQIIVVFVLWFEKGNILRMVNQPFSWYQNQPSGVPDQPVERGITETADKVVDAGQKAGRMTAAAGIAAAGAPAVAAATASGGMKGGMKAGLMSTLFNGGGTIFRGKNQAQKETAATAEIELEETPSTAEPHDTLSSRIAGWIQGDALLKSDAEDYVPENFTTENGEALEDVPENPYKPNTTEQHLFYDMVSDHQNPYSLQDRRNYYNEVISNIRDPHMKNKYTSALNQIGRDSNKFRKRQQEIKANRKAEQIEKKLLEREKEFEQQQKRNKRRWFR